MMTMLQRSRKGFLASALLYKQAEVRMSASLSRRIGICGGVRDCAAAVTSWPPMLVCAELMT